MNRPVVATLAVIAIAAAIYLLWPLPRNPPTASESEAHASTGSRTDPVASVPPADEPQTNRAALRGDNPGARRSTSEAAIRGRCVTPQGQPIAGVTAAWSARSRERTVTRFTTGPDGRFEFPIILGDGWVYALKLTAENRVGMEGGWFGLADSTDLGDIALIPGCIVHGRVVDSRGVPQPQTTIVLGTGPASDATSLRPKQVHTTTTGDDGSYRLSPCSPGAKRVTTRYSRLRTPTEITVPESVAKHYAEITVESPEDWPSIRGQIVDNVGTPVPGVTVSTNRWVRAKPTDAAGRFTIMKPSKARDEPQQLRASRLGYCDHSSSEPYPWGTADLRITLRPCAGRTIRVTDGADPIENFSIWITEAPGVSRSNWLRYERIRNRGHHRNGEAVIQGLRDGDYQFKVLPSEARFLESAFLPLRIDAKQAKRIEVVLEQPINRTVRVQWADGTPITGAKVELIESSDPDAITPNTSLARHGSHLYRLPGYRRLEVATESTGEALLRGPARGAYLVRVSGEGFPVAIRRDLNFSKELEARPFVVTIPRPSTVTGRIGPPLLLQQLRQLQPKATSLRFGLRLERRGAGPRTTVPPGKQPAPISKDGSYTIEDASEGTWMLTLLVVSSPTPNSVLMSRFPVGEVVDLRASETRRHDLHLPHLVFGTVDLRVIVDGSPLTSRNIYLAGEHRGQSLRGDPTGQFRGFVQPGRYLCQVYVGEDQLLAEEFTQVHSGHRTEQTLRIRTCQVVFRVVMENGKPPDGVRLFLGREKERFLLSKSAIDTGQPVRCSTGPIRIWGAPKAGSADSGKRVLLVTDRIQKGADPQEITVRIPESLGY